MLDNDKYEDTSEEAIVGLNEVASPDVRGMILQECSPSLTGRSKCPKFAQIRLDSVLSDSGGELEQLSSDPFSTPDRILGCHLLDQIDRLLGDSTLMAPGSRPATPNETKQISMPAQQRVRLNDMKRLFPVRRQIRQTDQSDAIIIR